MKAFLFAVLIVSATANAAAKEVFIYSYPSRETCADYVQERKNPDQFGQRLQAWVLGYVSAYNVYASPSGDVGQGGNGNALLAWMDNYCAANPLDRIFIGANSLVRELAKRSGEPLQ